MYKRLSESVNSGVHNRALLSVIPCTIPMETQSLAKAMLACRWREPEKGATGDQILSLLGMGTNPFEHAHVCGHFSASAWLVAADGSRVLLTRHRKPGH